MANYISLSLFHTITYIYYTPTGGQLRFRVFPKDTSTCGLGKADPSIGRGLLLLLNYSHSLDIYTLCAEWAGFPRYKLISEGQKDSGHVFEKNGCLVLCERKSIQAVTIMRYKSQHLWRYGGASVVIVWVTNICVRVLTTSYFIIYTQISILEAGLSGFCQQGALLCQRIPLVKIFAT